MQTQVQKNPVEKQQLTQKHTTCAQGDPAVNSQPQEALLKDPYRIRTVSDFLLTQGLYPHLLGYRYLRSAVLHGLADPCFFDNLSQICYPELAREFHTNERCVERAIRHALGRAADGGHLSALQQLERCSNREFMVKATECVRIRLR